MIAYPNAKINIGLRITGKLDNGYHSLKSLMLPTGLCDILEFIPSTKDRLDVSGIEIPGDPEDNILSKVLYILRNKYKIPPLHIHLHKIIPTGAGLGGGSADASFFLNMINDFFQLEMSSSFREKLISGVGSDCPFFIRNQPAIITGRGEITEPYPLNLKNNYLYIFFPKFSISTALAYSGVKPKTESIALEKLLRQNLRQWRNNIINEFEKNLFPAYPELKELKTEIYKTGAIFASLSGSGSALYGLYEKPPLLTEKLERIKIWDELLS